MSLLPPRSGKKLPKHPTRMALRYYQQRPMQEVPEQMTQGIAAMELDASEPARGRHDSTTLTTPATPAGGAYGSAPYTRPQFPPRRSSSSYDPTTPQTPVTQHRQQLPSQPQSLTGKHDYSKVAPAPDLPNFSVFPKLVNPPSNVPPTDDEREGVLENARIPVLNSNDPEMQLAWAQDALAYVDAAMLNEQRLSETQAARPTTPQVEHQLRVDSMNVVSFLAEQHHPKAEFLKGMWLEFGKFGMRVDKREAFRCYSRAAERGYVRAEYRMGMQFEQSNDPIKALIHYKRGAEAGDSASNYRLGMMTLLGQHGQQQDHAKGVQMIRQAAATADENAPQGAYVLGMLQARELPQINIPEIFLPYDENAARQNIEKAAYLGFAKAQLKMGSAYELCTLGCDFNPALSLHYNALASRQGEAEADMAISKWFLCGYEGLFQKNEELAYVYAQRAAAAGLATAEFAMGYFNEIGMYVPVNLEKAMEWYEKAAKQGNTDASGRIESISKSKTLSKKDHENVAVNRIRSQHGSMRGKRPDRFKAQAPGLPTINDTPASPAGQAPPGDFRAPSRGANSTPYPLDSGPPKVDPFLRSASAAPIQRPATVAPYPEDSGPPRNGPTPLGGFFATDRPATVAPPEPQRSSAAFNINPNVYNNGPSGRGRGGPGVGLQPRPYTSVGDMRGGGPSQGGRGAAMGGQRVVSGPPPSGYRQPGGPSVTRPERESAPPQFNNPPPGPPKLDIGFQAPPDDRRGRLQKPGNPKVQQLQGKVQDLGYQAPLSPKRNDAPQLPHTQSFDAAGRPPRTFSLEDRPGSAAPGPRASSRPNSPGRAGRQTPPQQPQQQHPPRPQLQTTNTAPTGAAKPLPSPKPPAKLPATPTAPGKGPKTFEEMGVPQTKADDQCVSSHYNFSCHDLKLIREYRSLCDYHVNRDTFYYIACIALWR